MKDFYFANGGHKLDGTIFYPPRKKDKYPSILLVHGWASNRVRSFQYARSLTELGYICLLFDMRGHGTSEGDRNILTIKDFLSDVIAAYDYLIGITDVDDKNISAVGSSFGGYLITLLSKKRNIKNLALRAAANRPNETFNKTKNLSSGYDSNVVKWRKQPRQPTDTYALEAVHKFEGNILIIESEKDDIVPKQTTLNYINSVKDKSKLTHVVLKGAPHSLKEGKFRDEVKQILVKWFKNKF